MCGADSLRKALAKEGAQLCGGVAKGRKEVRLHVEDRHAGSVAGEVYGSDDSSVRSINGDGEGAEADFELLIHDGIAEAANSAKREAKFFYGDDGSSGVGCEFGARQIGLQLLRRKIGE